DFTAQVHERAAGVAAVNGGVMPNPPDQPAHVLAVQPKATEGAENLGITISTLLMMPSVTDCERAIGLPIARMESPTPIFDESPNMAGTNSRGFSGLSLSTEISVRGSVPTSSAGISSRSHKVQTMRA